MGIRIPHCGGVWPRTHTTGLMGKGYLDGGLSTFAALVVVFALVAAVGGLGAFAALVHVFVLSLVAPIGGLGALAALIVVFALAVVAPVD